MGIGEEGSRAFHVKAVWANPEVGEPGTPTTKRSHVSGSRGTETHGIMFCLRAGHRDALSLKPLTQDLPSWAPCFLGVGGLLSFHLPRRSPIVLATSLVCASHSISPDQNTLVSAWWAPTRHSKALPGSGSTSFIKPPPKSSAEQALPSRAPEHEQGGKTTD